MYGDEKNIGRVFFTNLGCPKNEVDEHTWLCHLSESGFKMVREPEQADFIFVNTCAFIEDARRESQEVIENLGKIKDKDQKKRIFITGCWAQKEGDKLFNRFPFIDGVLGNLDIQNSFDTFISNSDKLENFTHIPQKPSNWYPATNILPKTFPYAYLKIAEGCDNNCTYCLLPSIRDSYRSIPINILLEQASFLAKNDFKEIILVAQDTSRYGQDLEDEMNLPMLLEKLNEIEGNFKIRVMYAHPLRVTQELIEKISHLPKVIKYLDIPLQHYDSEILSAMGRGYSHEYIDKLTETIHSIDNEIVMRTTFIVGFPGETDAKFEQLLNFVSRNEFLHIGIFQYSLELGTAASRLPNRIPDDIINLRKDLIEMTHSQFLFQHNQKKVGSVVNAIIESKAIMDGFSIARMDEDAPEIDRHIKVQGVFYPGDRIKIRIIKALTNDFLGIAAE